MFKVNRKLEYALISLNYLLDKRPGELANAKEISDTTGCPFDAVSRSLQVMTQNQLLNSEQGAKGGYSIKKDLKKVSLFELSEMILGKQSLAKCLKSSESCELISNCNIHHPMKVLNEKTTHFLSEVTLFEMLLSHQPRKKIFNQEMKYSLEDLSV